MVIPDKVKVLYKEYTIREEQNLHDENADLYGQIQYLSEMILLNSYSSEEQKKATLVHEIIHALDEIYGIDLKEEQVEKLGNALYVFIRDNSKMFVDD